MRIWFIITYGSGTNLGGERIKIGPFRLPRKKVNMGCIWGKKILDLEHICQL